MQHRPAGESDRARAAALLRHTVARDLRGAAGRGELVLHYQPIVRLRDGALVGFESLVRWEHPVLGLVGPGDFIPAAEEAGLIVEIGDWVLDASCRQISVWGEQRRDGTVLLMSVNYSREQFLRPAAAARLAGVLARYGFPPHNLILEITERVLERDGPRVIAGMPRFRQVGVQLALDDFGTGFSSLSALGALPVQHLKLDRGFVQGMGAAGPRFEVVRAMVDLAHRLGMTVVAEGLETEAQLHVLQALGCDYGQGFLLAPPLDGGSAGELVRGEVLWEALWPGAWGLDRASPAR